MQTNTKAEAVARAYYENIRSEAFELDDELHVFHWEDRPIEQVVAEVMGLPPIPWDDPLGAEEYARYLRIGTANYLAECLEQTGELTWVL